MREMDRRTFLKIGARLAAVMGLGPAAAPLFAEGVRELASRRPPVLWLQGQSCSGCSVALLNSEPVTPDRLITEYLSLVFHPVLSAAGGGEAVDLVERAIGAGGAILVVEGSVPAGMAEACRFGERTFNDQLLRAVRGARAVLAIGTCACFGGIPAAENNPTGSTSVPGFLRKEGATAAPILIPGCPVHPDWLVGTMVHLLKFGVPELDGQGQPKAFFDRLVHDQCPRFADYERERFAGTFSEGGCLFRLGCQGPITRADCMLRFQNSRTSTCIRAGAPCLGCTSPTFSARAAFPFFTKERGEDGAKGGGR